MKKTKAITKERTDAANERENFEGKKMTTISNKIAMKKLAITCAISAMAFMLCGCATTPTKSREEMDNTQASLASITDEHSEDKKQSTTWRIRSYRRCVRRLYIERRASDCNSGRDCNGRNRYLRSRSYHEIQRYPCGGRRAKKRSQIGNRIQRNVFRS